MMIYDGADYYDVTYVYHIWCRYVQAEAFCLHNQVRGVSCIIIPLIDAPHVDSDTDYHAYSDNYCNDDSDYDYDYDYDDDSDYDDYPLLIL